MAERPRRQASLRLNGNYTIRKRATKDENPREKVKKLDVATAADDLSAVAASQPDEKFPFSTEFELSLEPLVEDASASSPGWDDAESTGAESAEPHQEDYSKDPDYAELESEEMQLSEDEYAEDSEVEASEVDCRGSEEEEWLEGEIRARPQQRAAQRPSSHHAFNNGVAAELVPWLKKNFRLSYNPAAIMPRSQLYNKYQRFCAKNKMTVVNSACLGKVLRRTFPGVDTRRLGRRGESKYHYIGLEINPKKDQEPSTEIAIEEPGPRTSVPPAFAVEKLRPKRLSYAISQAPPRSALLRVLSMFDLEDRENLYMHVFGKFCQSLGVGHSTFVPEYLKRYEDWIVKLPILETDIEIGTSIRREQVENYIQTFRIHLGIVAHCIARGAFLTLPDVFRNFWITRNESMQVPPNMTAARGVTDVLIMYDLVGCESFQTFTANCYLEMYSRLVDHFTPNFETVVGSGFTQLMNELIALYPLWLLQAVSSLHRGMADVVHCSAFAFCVMLRKRIALHSAFSLVQPVETDQPKADFILSIFREILPTWKKGMLKELNEDETETARLFVFSTYDILSGSVQSLTRWRSWADGEVLDVVEKAPLSELFASAEKQNEGARNRLRIFFYIVIITCKSLVSLAQTDRHTSGNCPSVEPFLWLLDFFQRYVAFLVEAELLKLEQKTAIFVIFQNAMEDRLREPSTQPIPVTLNTMNANVGNWFRTGMPRTLSFYTGSADLEPFTAMLDDRKVPEMAPLVGAGGDQEPVARRELSLLELLLR